MWCAVKNQFASQCNLQKNIKMKDCNKTKIRQQEVADIFWVEHTSVSNFSEHSSKIYVLSVAMFYVQCWCWGSWCFIVHFRTHSKIERNNKTHQHKRQFEEWRKEKEVIVAMVIDNLQTYRNKNYFISFMHLAFIAPKLAECLAVCFETLASISRVRQTEITLHRAISFTASQLNGLFSLLFFNSLYMWAEAFTFIAKTAGFRILFSSIITIFYRIQATTLVFEVRNLKPSCRLHFDDLAVVSCPRYCVVSSNTCTARAASIFQ